MANNRLCSIEGCGKPIRSAELCGMHYARMRRHGDPLKRLTEKHSSCTVDGCCFPHKAKGYCRIHYDRYLSCGDAKPGQKIRVSPGERIEWLRRHVNYEGPNCLIFPYSVDHKGYGRIRYKGQMITASRMMAILAHGEPPTSEHQSAHSCGNGHLACVHPKHVRWDTCSGNHADKVAHGTHMQGTDCPGHKLDESIVRSIRRMSGKSTQQQIANMFGIAQTTVSKIIHRKAWAWVIDDR